MSDKETLVVKVKDFLKSEKYNYTTPAELTDFVIQFYISTDRLMDKMEMGMIVDSIWFSNTVNSRVSLINDILVLNKLIVT